MRRASSSLRGETRPQKRICPPQTRSPHSDLSHPPLEVWCAEKVQHNFSSVWQLGDALGFPPLPSVLLPPADHVLGDTIGSLLQHTDPCRPSFSPVLHSPSSQTRTAGAFLRGGGRHFFHAFPTPQVKYVFLSTTLCFLYRISFTNGSAYQGYRFEFSAQFGPATHFSLGGIPPRFDGVQLTVINSASKASVLQQELSSLLQKGAIEEIPQSDIEQGFFSRYFLVPKRDGGLRPILDLRRLNLSLYKGKFKMLTMKTIMSQIQGGDWFVTIDLKDAYFHIQVVQRHRKFLRFAFGGKAYQYKVLPFGLALARRMFTKCMDAALARLRFQGIRVLNYLEDWLILAHSRESVSHHRDIVLRHIHSLGLRMNAKKSVLFPSQRTVFLGVHLDSVQMQARLAPPRISNFIACLAHFKLGHHVSVSTCRRLLGLMAAASPVLPLGLLHMRPFLWWMKELRLHPTIPATRSCFRPLLQWRDPAFLQSGVRMSPAVFSADRSGTRCGLLLL